MRPNEHAERCEELAAILIKPLREVARRHGYALGVHGSLRYDIDLIAVPWREGCSSPHDLAGAIQNAVKAIVGNAAKLSDDIPESKPHGRLAWAFHMGGGPYVDLSVFPSTSLPRVREPDIEAMVSRFLSWKLPDDFYPDGGVSFKALPIPPHTWPTGTNLLHAGQAEQMVRYILGEEK